MAKKVSQIRWFGEGNELNYPTNITLEKLRYGTAFPRTYPIIRFSVQALPGTKIFINSGPAPIIIGSTGIYELDVEGLTNISSISFDMDSLQIIGRTNTPIIIDYICETE